MKRRTLAISLLGAMCVVAVVSQMTGPGVDEGAPAPARESTSTVGESGGNPATPQGHDKRTLVIRCTSSDSAVDEAVIVVSRAAFNNSDTECDEVVRTRYRGGEGGTAVDCPAEWEVALLSITARGYRSFSQEVELEADVQELDVELIRSPDLIVDFGESGGVIGGGLTALVWGKRQKEEGGGQYFKRYQGAQSVEATLPLGSSWEMVRVSVEDSEEPLAVFVNESPGEVVPLIPPKVLRIGSAAKRTHLQLGGGEWGAPDRLTVKVLFRGRVVLASGHPDGGGRFAIGEVIGGSQDLTYEVVSAEGERLLRDHLSVESAVEGILDVELPSSGGIRIELECSNRVRELLDGETVGVATDGTRQEVGSGVWTREDGTMELVRQVQDWHPSDGVLVAARCAEVSGSGSITVDRVAVGGRSLLLLIPALDVKYPAYVQVAEGEVAECRVRVRGYEDGGAKLVARDDGDGRRIRGATWLINGVEVAVGGDSAVCRLEVGDTVTCSASGYALARRRVDVLPGSVFEIRLQEQNGR